MQAIDRLVQKIRAKNSCICVGLDPRFHQIPEEIKEPIRREIGENRKGLARVLVNFNRGILQAVQPYAPIVKFQISFYEQYGWIGLQALENSCQIARQMGFEILLDAKRNDISSTARAYANGYLGEVDVWGKKEETIDIDSMTINPYLGRDGVEPFMEIGRQHEKGLWVLVKTSNPSSGDLQDLTLADGNLVYERVAHQLQELGKIWLGECVYSNLGMVVGATYPEVARRLREMLPHTFFLIPGYGAQGAQAKDLQPFFNQDGLGGIVNSSRGIIFPKREAGEPYFQAVARVAEEMRDAINEIR